MKLKVGIYSGIWLILVFLSYFGDYYVVGEGPETILRKRIGCNNWKA